VGVCDFESYKFWSWRGAKEVNVINVGARCSVSCNPYESPALRRAIRNHASAYDKNKWCSYCRWRVSRKDDALYGSLNLKEFKETL
jgi:hypothetical protein